MSTKPRETEAEETRFKFGRDGGFEINFKRKRPHKENPLQTAQATLPKPVEPTPVRPHPPLMQNYGAYGNAEPDGLGPERGRVPHVNDYPDRFSSQPIGDVIPMAGAKQKLLEGGYVPRGGGPRGGPADVTKLPSTIERQTRAPMSQQEKYDAAVYKQQSARNPKAADTAPKKNPNPLHTPEFYDWATDFSKRINSGEPFKVLDKRFTHEAMKSFYKDPHRAIQELKDGLPHVKGDLQQDATRLIQHFEAELGQGE